MGSEPPTDNDGKSTDPETERDVVAEFFGPAADHVPPSDGYQSGFVALIGRPNVGKSTLLNAFVGEKVAIVSHRPQTTRRRILGIRTTEGAQVIFVDTPGIHEPRHALGQTMVDVARAAVPDADAVVWVIDVSRLPGDMDREIAAWLVASGQPIALALNKSDLLAPSDIEPHTEAYRGLVDAGDRWTLTIATEGHNLDRLWDLVVELLPPGPPLYPTDAVSDQTDRVLAAELVREAALKYLQQEVPHGVEVVVTDWREPERGAVHIDATLFIEREAHKPIVIGRRGAMLKKIGTAGRRAIEDMLGRGVYLELFVKVKPGWRKRSDDVRRFGFQR